MTKKLKAMLFGVLASIATSPLMADMSAHSGPYVAVMGALTGVEVDGRATNSSDEVTTGSMGRIFGVAGGEIGWVFGLGDRFGVGIGGTYLGGDASIEADPGAGNSATNEQVAIDIKNHWTAFIQPMVSITESSAVYIKLGHTEADLEITGDVTSPPDGVNGDTYALGTRSTTAGGLFMQVEAGAVDYEKFTITKSSTTGTANADPLTAYGSLTIGFKF